MLQEKVNTNTDKIILGERTKVSLVVPIFGIIIPSILICLSFVGMFYFTYLIVLFIVGIVAFIILLCLSIRELRMRLINNVMEHPLIVYYASLDCFELYGINKRIFTIPTAHLIGIKRESQLKVRFYYEGKVTTIFLGYCSLPGLIKNKIQDRCKHQIKEI